MIRVLVSACLLGERVRYNGAAASVTSDVLGRWLDEGRVVSFCPELAGGRALVVTNAARDVTAAFLRGAHAALAAARAQDARLAILKDGSPSCGRTAIHDGTFTGTTREGLGVTAALLERHGIRVFTERQVTDAAEYLEGLERRSSTSADRS